MPAKWTYVEYSRATDFPFLLTLTEITKGFSQIICFSVWGVWQIIGMDRWKKAVNELRTIKDKFEHLIETEFFPNCSRLLLAIFSLGLSGHCGGGESFILQLSNGNPTSTAKSLRQWCHLEVSHWQRHSQCSAFWATLYGTEVNFTLEFCPKTKLPYDAPNIMTSLWSDIFALHQCTAFAHGYCSRNLPFHWDTDRTWQPHFSLIAI